jgi:hypothetical protein
MTTNDQIRSLASALKPADNTAVTITKAVVTAVNLAATPPSLDCQIGGDTSTTVAAVRFIDSYSPVVGDACLIVKQGSDVFALGHVDDTNEGTSANGWQTPSLNANYTTNGNSNGPLLYRIVVDNGDRKVQFKGSVALTGSPGSAIFTLPVGYRPAAKMSLLCSRDPGGGSNVEQVDIQTDGQVVRVGSTIGIKTVTIGTSGATATSTGEPVSGYGSNGSGVALTDAPDGGDTSSAHKHAMGHHHDIAAHTHTSGTVTPTAVSMPAWIGFNGVEYFL